MSVANLDIPALLRELAGMPAQQRLARLEQAGEIAPLLLALSDEAERSISIGVADALGAGDVVVALADASGSAPAGARARRARGRALAHAGRFDEALRDCEDGVRMAQQTGEAIEAARLRLASMHALGELGRFDEAIAAGEAARVVFIKAGEPALAARADLNLGTVHQRRDDPRSALAHFDRARPQLIDVPIMAGSLQNNRGEALIALNEFAAAEAAFQSALQEFERADATLLAAISEGNLADLAARQGRLQKAMAHFERARRRLESDASPGHLARLLTEQAEALLTLGLTQESISEFNLVIPQLDAMGLVLEAARARAGLGRALLRAGRPREADGPLAQAVDAFARLGNQTAAAKANLLRAEVVLADGDTKTAVKILHAAMEILKLRPADALAVRRMLVKVAIHAGAFHEAGAHLEPALAAAMELDLAPLLADLLHLRGQVRLARGEPDSAADDWRAAIRHVERIRDTLAADRFRAAFLGDRLAVYDDLIRLLLDQRDAASTAEAFALAERARSRSLLDLMRGAIDEAIQSHLAEVDPDEAAMIAELQTLRGELNALYSKLEQEPGNPGAPGTRLLGTNWHESLLERERQLETLESRLSTTRGLPGLYGRPIDLHAAMNLVPRGTALIEYFVAGDELLAFALCDGRTSVFRRLGDVQEIGQSVARLHFQINRALRPGAMEDWRGQRLEDDARHELEALGQALLAPMARDLAGATRLLIIPHGQLHLVPFHALMLDGQHVIERFEVHCCPSASMLAHLQAEHASPSRRAAALVVGVADEVAPRITTEARRVAAILGCHNEQLLLEGSATADRVGRAMRRAGVVHLACHGRFSTQTPLGSGIRLADRWMTVRDICAMRLQAELVTLSGCETGRSMVRAGDELVGLQRGFFAAGAPSLLVSLWRVDDESSAELMCRFYESWRGTESNGVSKAAALRTAQQAMLARRPHPAFWAPFALVGQP